MLTLELSVEEEEFIGIVEELCLRVSVIVAVKACEFLIILWIISVAIDESL